MANSIRIQAADKLRHALMYAGRSTDWRPEDGADLAAATELAREGLALLEQASKGRPFWVGPLVVATRPQGEGK